jgi:hypothetical protein
MKCIFCDSQTRGKNKYCSTKCIKRAYYVRKNPDVQSFFIKNSNFLQTETGIGFKWEKYIADLIGAEHLEFNYGGVDLQKDGKLIDVKACNLYKRKFKRGKPVKKEQSGNWIFNRNKVKPVDYFFCVCLIDDKPVKILKIPSEHFPLKGATIGQKSKYDKFKFTGKIKNF